MNAAHVIVSNAFQDFAEIPKSTCIKMPEACSDLWRWRGEMIEDDEDDIGAIFTNQATLYSIVVFESEGFDYTEFIDVFNERLAKLLCQESGSQIYLEAPVVCKGASQSLIASMNNLRQLIEERRLKGRSWKTINQLPYKPLKWRTPEEAFRMLVSKKLG